LPSRPEKEHDRDSRPHPSPGPTSGPAGARRRDQRFLPLRIGEIARVGGARLRVCEAFCWRGFLLARLRADDGRNDGHQDKERTMPLSPCMEGSMAGREPCTDTLFASEDLLCLSPEDDLRPPARETLSVSPYEGENLVLEVSETPALASLPFIGENKRGLPLHRRGLGSGGWRNPDSCVSPRKQDSLCLSPEDDLRPPARERT